MSTPSQRIKARALELGFAGAGIAQVAPLEAHARYEAWLGSGHHGGMAWLASERQRNRRRDPSLILPGVRSVVCVALAHEPEIDADHVERLGRVARYAVSSAAVGTRPASSSIVSSPGRTFWYGASISARSSISAILR